MAEQEMYFRPPSEAESFLIRVMHGCPHNRCTFCNIFKNVPFRPIPVEEVEAGMRSDAEDLGPKFVPMVKSLYLEGGDPLFLPTADLLRIMASARQCFPQVSRFACYATARHTIRKPQSELDALGAAGLQRVFVGLESGCDAILASSQKGCTAADLRQAGDMLRHAGIELDVSLILGIGGAALSTQHAQDTAALLNALSPACVRLRTFVPKQDTPLGAAFTGGGFELMEPAAILRELRLMTSLLESPMRLLSEHWTAFVHFDANLPEDKAPLLALLDDTLKLPPDAFRRQGLSEERS